MEEQEGQTEQFYGRMESDYGKPSRDLNYAILKVMQHQALSSITL